MSDLVTWLRAQLDEDERVARAATEPVDAEPDAEGSWPGWPWRADDTSTLGWVNHCMRHGPARVLAEVAAKRRILDAHEEAARFYDMPANRHHPAGEVHGLYTAIKHLALPYADQPGYREEWRP